jgi:ABC-type transporter Mla subunit MlaD
MSLGPPFDASGLRTQRAVGAVAALLLAAAIAWALFGAGRSLGPGIVVHVHMRSTGPLRPGALVRLAGRRIGQVRAARMAGRADRDGVVFDVFLGREWAREVRRNSELFVSTPSVLGEAYLEIGPPRREPGQPPIAPGAPVADGDTIEGTPPPEIDRFLEYAEANVREVLALLRETRPETDEFLTALDSMLARLSSLPADRGQLRRIKDQAVAALDRGAELFAVLRDADAIARVRRIARDLGDIADRAGPELRDVAAKVDRSLARVEELRALYGERGPDVARALDGFRRAGTLFERMLADVRAVQARIDAGLGTVGAFLADREMIDDLHETHRILKSTPLRFIWKADVNTNRPVLRKPPKAE